ncbi:ribonuclease H-like domain-containing protein [Tanacetum coccineum]
MTSTKPPSYQFLDDNLDTSPIALRLLTTPTSPQQTPPQTKNPQKTPQTNPQTPQTTPLTPLSTPSPQTTPTPPTTAPPPLPPPPPTSQHPMVTRSKVGIIKSNPKYNLHVTTSSPIPKSPFHALRDPNWKQAMCDEYKALIDNNTWIVLSLAVSRQWPIHQLDVKNAFLHGHLTETVYMYQPPGFTDSSHSDYVCLLQKSLYGPKQAPRACFFYFTLATYHLFTTCGVCYDRPWPTQLFSQYICHATPIDTEKKLGPEGSPITDPTFYRTIDLGLQLLRSTTSQLIAYSDADWVDTLCHSSAEAEYHGVANAVAETSWIRNLLRELHTPLFIATLVYCDNVSAVYMSANPVQHQRTKHIKIDIHFVRDKVAAGHVRVLHVPSRFQYADIFTKGLPYPLFADLRSSLSVRKTPALTAGMLAVINNNQAINHIFHVPVWGCDRLVSRAKVIKNQVMAISVISVSSDSLEESVRTSAGRVILFGTIPTTIPDTTPVITLPTIQTDTTYIPIIAPTIPPSPDYTLTSLDYSPASDSESDPSEDPSSDHIPPLLAISPFLSSAGETTDSDTPDTPPSPTHGTPFTEITIFTQRSPIIPRH